MGSSGHIDVESLPQPNKTEEMRMSILFINASPNKYGNTAKLAKTLLAGKDYETLKHLSNN